MFMIGWKNPHAKPPTDSGNRKMSRAGQKPFTVSPNHAQDLIQDIKICAPQYDKSKALIRHQNAAPFIEVSKLSQDFSLFLIPSPSRRLGTKATRLISTATQQT
jgi:hypothetical protein